MVDDTEIRKDLRELTTLYNNNIGNDNAKYYSKLAVLEVCGWIEQTIDSIATNCVNTHLKEQSNVVQFNILLSHTSSFDYDDRFQNHFRNLLLNLLGFINLEKLEKKLDQRKFLLMKSCLGSLKVYRDSHAHTFIPGTTAQFLAPSSTKTYFEHVYQGLKDIDSKMVTIFNPFSNVP